MLDVLRKMQAWTEARRRQRQMDDAIIRGRLWGDYRHIPAGQAWKQATTQERLRALNQANRTEGTQSGGPGRAARADVMERAVRLLEGKADG